MTRCQGNKAEQNVPMETVSKFLRLSPLRGTGRVVARGDAGFHAV